MTISWSVLKCTIWNATAITCQGRGSLFYHLLVRFSLFWQWFVIYSFEWIFQLLLAAASSNLLNQDNISSVYAPVKIEGCIFVNGLSTSGWRSYRNCSFAILLLWKVWELTNYVLILLYRRSLSGDLNSASSSSSFFVFILGCAAFRLKL